MPLYMDRHDLPGVTPEEVAQAHALDLAPAARHGVSVVSYWFDQDTASVFCLAKATSKEDLVAVHREAHGLIPNKIIDVSEDNVLRFLGGIHEPADHTEISSPFRTVLFTDLEGSTSLLQRVGQAAFMVLLTEHDLIIRRALVATRGREVKHTGDGIMAAFDHVPDALRAGVAIQRAFDARTESGATPEMRVRIGMAAGEPVERNDDLFGSTVNLAARICDAADAGHTLVSEMVHDLGVQHGFDLRALDDRPLKGFSTPTPVFELLRSRDEAA
jgi:class 3 adenylate cyclase